MKLVCWDDDVLELRGRRAKNESGEEGLWLVWVVGFTFCVFSSCATWAITTGGQDVSGGMIVPLLFFGLAGCIGLAMLVWGVTLAMRREYLTLDRREQQGVYGYWSPWRGSLTRRKFDFRDAADVTLRRKVESVGGRTGEMEQTSQVYSKLECRLRIRPRSAIVIARSKRDSHVRGLANALATTLHVDIIDKT